MNNLVTELYNKIEDGREGKNLGLKTGIPKLDFYTGGFKKGVYKLTFSKSSVGKSSFIIYTDIYRILKDYPDKDVLIIYFSLELSANTLLAKLLSLYIYETFGVEVTYMELLSFTNKLDDKLFEYVQKSKQWLESVTNKFIIIDKQLSANSFYAEMMELYKSLGVFQKTSDGKRTVFVPNNSNLIVNVVIDHLLLVNPQNGRTKKEEMDLISTYCVRFRELCQTSFDIIMQENRNSTSMDRRKAGMEEPTVDEIQQSAEPLQAADICIALFSPYKTQLKTYRGYKIIDDSEGYGLEDVCRSCIILKNRYGISNRIIMTAFQGSIGKFYPLPSPDQIVYEDYLSWRERELKDTNEENKTVKDAVLEDQKNHIKFKF